MFSGGEPNTNYIKTTSAPGWKGDLLIMEAGRGGKTNELGRSKALVKPSSNSLITEEYKMHCARVVLHSPKAAEA